MTQQVALHDVVEGVVAHLLHGAALLLVPSTGGCRTPGGQLPGQSFT